MDKLCLQSIDILDRRGSILVKQCLFDRDILLLVLVLIQSILLSFMIIITFSQRYLCFWITNIEYLQVVLKMQDVKILEILRYSFWTLVEVLLNQYQVWLSLWISEGFSFGLNWMVFLASYSLTHCSHYTFQLRLLKTMHKLFPTLGSETGTFLSPTRSVLLDQVR